MNRFKTTVGCVLCAAGIFIQPVSAQTNQETIDLGVIVVTPHKTGVEDTKAGSKVDTVSVSTQMRRGNYSLSSALSDNTSVIAVRSGGIGGDTSLFLRGNASYHTRFLLDGVKIYDPMLTQAYYNSTHFFLNGLDKIEISKGPQSSLYGSDAIGGVINMTTKKAKKDFGISYMQEFGSFNTYTEQLDLEQKIGKVSYAASILRIDSGGFSSTSENEGNHERDPYHNTNASLRLDWETTEDVSIRFTERFIRAQYEYDGSDPVTWAPSDDDDRYATERQNFSVISLTHRPAENLSHSLTLGLTGFKREYTDDTDATIDDWYRSKTYQCEWKADYRPSRIITILCGLEYVREKGDFYSPSGDFPKNTLNNKGVFIETIFTPFENLFTSASYRRDEHSAFAGEDSKRATVSYTFPVTDTTVKGSYGEGFKAPSMYQLYAPASLWGPIGNTTLSPEHSKTYEAEVRQKITKNTAVVVTCFKTLSTNLIDFVAGTGYTNISKARIKGIEASCDYSLNENWQLHAAYTWLDTENKENHAQLERRPQNKAAVTMAGTAGNWETNFTASYTGHRTQGVTGATMLKPYVLIAVSATYNVNEHCKVFIRGENLLDYDYELQDHYQTKKAALYGGFKILF